MKPGRELDALVAEKVMGWKVIRSVSVVTNPNAQWVGVAPTGTSMRGEPVESRVPKLSTEIAAAWEVVENFDEDDWTVALHSDDIGWYCGLSRINSDGGSTVFKGESGSAPHAICLAALKAVGVEIPEDP